jgi:hypothetical protein
MRYANCFDAIREANFLGSYGVAWEYGTDGKPGEWLLYNPVDGCPKGARPEFFCFHSGVMPMPLSEPAIEIMMELKGIK